MTNLSAVGAITDPTAVVEHWLAGGEMLPTQLPVPSFWSPEKKLAAAVLRDALIAVRQNAGEPRKRRWLAQDLAWISSDEVNSTFAFVPLCELFGFDPAWVRAAVARWLAQPGRARTRYAPRFQHAA